jgi:hypothetical protein
LAVKFFFALSYFLNNSTARWFFRGTDDTYINFNALLAYFQQLEKKFNPEIEFVFRANCVGSDEYPQGGSGYLLSRAAARILEPHCQTFLSGIRHAEDVDLQTFLPKFGITMFNITDEAFNGHGFSNDDIKRLKNRQYHLLPQCSRVDDITTDGCRPFLSPVRQIVFYHEYGRPFEQSRTDIQFVTSAHPAVHWWLPPKSAWPKLCLASGPERVSLSSW